MAFEKPGGVVWGSGQQPQEISPLRQLATMAAFTGVGAAAVYGFSNTYKSGYSGLDYAWAGARFLGTHSPMQIGNTFRFPEAISPFVSDKALNATGGVSWDLTSYSDARAGRGATSTYKYLKQITGLSDRELESRGIYSAGTGPNAATSLVFRRDKGRNRGTLSAVQKIDGKDVVHRLSSDVWLAERTFENKTGNAKGINKWARGVMQALGLTEDDNFDADKVLSQFGIDQTTGHTDWKSTRLLPIPAGDLESFRGVKSKEDLWRVTSYLRSFSATSMERLNTLMAEAPTQMPFIGEAAEFIEKGLGGTGGGRSVFNVRSGPGLSMFLRYGKLAAGIGAAGIGLAELDYWRDKGNFVGNIGVSTVIAGGLSTFAHKAGLGMRTSLGVGAISLAAQLALPGFNEGVVPGVVTTWQHAMVARAAFSPFSVLRRTAEGFLPGVSTLETGALLGIGAVTASAVAFGKEEKNLFTRAYEQVVGEIRESVDVLNPDGTRQLHSYRRPDTQLTHMKRLADAEGIPMGNKYAWLDDHPIPERLKFYGRIWDGLSTDPNQGLEFFKTVNRLHAEADSAVADSAPENLISWRLENRLRDIDAKFNGKKDIVSQTFRTIEGSLETFIHAGLGADLSNPRIAKAINNIGFKPFGGLGRYGVLFAGTVFAQQLMTGGLLGSMDSASDLAATYRGEKLVEVKKGRLWEGGSTPIGGEGTAYFRPHLSYLIKEKVRDKATYGSHADSSPIAKFFLANFTYELEKENYYSRPYPISGAAFENIPVIGRLLANTIGRVIKPAKILHAGEWMREGAGGGIEYADTYEGWKREPAYNLGAPTAGQPEHHLGWKKNLGNTINTFRDLEGMTGWAKSLVWDQLTGDDSLYKDLPQLAAASEMTNPIRPFWELQFGGMLFMNEPIRRFLTKDYNKGDKINPILNAMPSWLPENFKRGDPYTKLEWGEARLPGAGYAAIHKELAGVDPENYPLLTRYEILADVSPWSPEFRRTQKMLFSKRQKGATSEAENRRMDYITGLLKKRMEGVEGRPDPRSIQVPILSTLTQTPWNAMKSVIRETTAPAEYLIPMGFRPVHKLMGADRTPIEQYEYERLYGSTGAFWDKPWRDWFRPSLYSAMHMTGYDAKPAWRQEADYANQVFDEAEFYKWMKLSQQAEAEGDVRKTMQYKYMAANTRTGVNPMGSPLSVYWTLPAEDRKFFNAFLNAEGKERSRIMEMVPEDQVGLYKAMWSRIDAGDTAMWAGDKTPIDESYMAGQYSRVSQGAMPGNDWIGWHEDVAINDIKALYINSIGAEIHDYGLWENQLKQAQRQPYLEGSEQAAYEMVEANRNFASQTAYRMLSNGLDQPSITAFSRPSYNTSYNVNFSYNDDREAELKNAWSNNGW